MPVNLLDLVPTALDYAGVDPLALDTRGPAAAERLPLPGQSLQKGEMFRIACLDRPVVGPFKSILQIGRPGFVAGPLAAARQIAAKPVRVITGSVPVRLPDDAQHARGFDPEVSNSQIAWHLFQ